MWGAFLEGAGIPGPPRELKVGAPVRGRGGRPRPVVHVEEKRHL